MSKGLLDPKVDLVFKNIFGSEKNPDILISFLNDTLKPIKKISKVEIKGTDIGKQFIEEIRAAKNMDILTISEIVEVDIDFIERVKNGKDI